MNKVLVNDGDLVYLTFSDRVIELRVNNFHPLGFEIAMIYNKVGYEKMYKQTSKELKKQAKDIDKKLESWN